MKESVLLPLLAEASKAAAAAEDSDGKLREAKEKEGVRRRAKASAKVCEGVRRRAKA